MNSQTPSRPISWEDFAARRGPFFWTLRRTKILCASLPAQSSFLIIFVLYVLALSRMSVCLQVVRPFLRYEWPDSLLFRHVLCPSNTLSVLYCHTGINRDKPKERFVFITELSIGGSYTFHRHHLGGASILSRLSLGYAFIWLFYCFPIAFSHHILHLTAIDDHLEFG